MKNMQNLKRAKLLQAKKSTQQNGVVLLESLIAILIFSMGILALVGLQAAMVKNTSDNKYRVDASFLAQESIGNGWLNTANSGGVSNVGDIVCVAGAPCEDVSAILPNGKRTVAVTARGLVTVTVSWQAPGGDAHNYTTSTYIGAY
jgi:type IV pilus assembly protein PilV